MILEKSNIEGFIKSIVDELRKMATTETVVGKPIKIENQTVLPVIKFSVGFAAGGGEGTGEAPASKQGKTGKGTGYGQGGGGGIKVDPVAFITVHKDKATLIPVTKKGTNIDKLVEAAPDLVEKIQTIIEKKEKKE